MKKLLLLITSIFLLASTACANDSKVANSSDQGALTNMKISIKIASDNGNHKLNASLEDNSSATAFYELLQKGPLTVKMTDYGNFEKVGSLGTNLPRNDRQITTQAGDIILYQGNQITIYYDTNNWSFTRLGKVVSTSGAENSLTSSTTTITQAELKNILGKGDVTAVFEVLK